MMKSIVALITGTIFGLGLNVSQMTNPHKVLSFLNILENWDPSLIIVMASAVAISTLGFLVSKRLEKPVVADSFHFPTQKKITLRLVLGAVLFGIGWGVAGLCPGPAIASLATPSKELIIFLLSMMSGMLLAKRLT